MKTRKRSAAISKRRTKSTHQSLSKTVAPTLNKKQIDDLTARVLTGDLETLDLLVKAHRPLVDQVCRKYHSQGLGREELIYQGNLGLIKGIQRYPKSDKSTSFKKYLLFFIKQSVLKAIHEQARIAKVPAQLLADLQALSQGFLQQQPVQAPEPSNDEMVSLLDEKIASITVFHKARA